MNKLTLPQQVEFVIGRLEEHGFSAFAVGGCVRDHLMGIAPTDYDVTTSATPSEMLRVFSGTRVIETGLKHGTLTILKDGMSVETTTYRIDGTYADGRHPDKVTFTPELRLDLERRDFTVNAMAYSEKIGLIDLFGGQNDLKNGIIRCVGRADDRFSEDGLRILRALRFSSVLNFTPDSECAESVRHLAQLLSKISRERIYTELTKLLLGIGAERILSDFSEIIAYCIPNLTQSDVKNAAKKISHAKKSPSIRYAILLDALDIEKANEAFSSLKPSKIEKSAVMTILRYKNYAKELQCDANYAIKSLISKTDDDFLPDLFCFLLTTARISENDAASYVRCYNSIVDFDEPRRLSDLKIKGSDLLELGFSGNKIGGMLTKVLDMVMHGELENSREEIVKFVQSDDKFFDNSQ